VWIGVLLANSGAAPKAAADVIKERRFMIGKVSGYRFEVSSSCH